MPGWLSRLMHRGPVKPENYPLGPVRDLATDLPTVTASLAEVELVALDLETTGLDPDRDAVLSIGWVPIVDHRVQLRQARQLIVCPPAGTEVGASATFHGLTDDQVRSAPPLEDVLPEILAALRGRVLVAHHAPIEVEFLGRAVQSSLRARLPLVSIDTLQMQRRLNGRELGERPPGSLRLDACRGQYGLPRYGAHLALTDAIGTAELLLAQAAELAHRRHGAPTLADLGARLTR